MGVRERVRVRVSEWIHATRVRVSEWIHAICYTLHATSCTQHAACYTLRTTRYTLHATRYAPIKGDSTSYWATNFNISFKDTAILLDRRILQIGEFVFSSILCFAEPVSRFGQRLEIQESSLDIKTKIETCHSRVMLLRLESRLWTFKS